LCSVFIGPEVLHRNEVLLLLEFHADIVRVDDGLEARAFVGLMDEVAALPERTHPEFDLVFAYFRALLAFVKVAVLQLLFPVRLLTLFLLGAGIGLHLSATQVGLLEFG